MGENTGRKSEQMDTRERQEDRKDKQTDGPMERTDIRRDGQKKDRLTDKRAGRLSVRMFVHHFFARIEAARFKTFENFARRSPEGSMACARRRR